MKALSIRQPWAWLIVQGYKDVENRLWPTRFRGRIYVHTGKQLDKLSSIEEGCIGAELDDKAWGEFLKRKWPLGAIVGSVEIVDCVISSSSPWFIGPYGFVLANPVVYRTPIPYKGELRLFEVEWCRIVT